MARKMVKGAKLQRMGENKLAGKRSGVVRNKKRRKPAVRKR